MKTIIWAATKVEAAAAGRRLGMDPRTYVPVGNAGANSLRGVRADQALILEGAVSERVAENIYFAVQSGKIVDLRVVRP